MTHKKKYIWLVIFSALIGALLFGIKIKKEYSDAEIPSSEIIPEPILEEMPQLGPTSNVLVEATNITIYPVGMLLGGTGFGIAAFLIGRIIIKKYNIDLTKGKKSGIKKDTKFNIMLLLLGVALNVVLWIGFCVVVFHNLGLISEAKYYLITRAIALITIPISWIPICKLLRWNKKFSNRINRIFLGPFNKFKLPFLNTRQHQVIWITILIIILQFLIPPWMGYKTLGDGEPYGPTHFVGFHVIQPYPEEASFYEMDYFCPEIDFKFLGYILLTTVTCSLVCIAYFGLFNKRAKEKLNQ